MRTWLMFKNHYGRDLPLPAKERMNFTDRRFASHPTSTPTTSDSRTRNPWHKRRERVEAYPVEQYLLLAAAILFAMGIIYFLVW